MIGGDRMLVLVLGIAKVGKTYITNVIEDRYDAYVIHTDPLRREWGYHSPNMGFPTEVSDKDKPLFYKELKDEVDACLNMYSVVLIEGNAIDPGDVDYFDPDVVVVLGNKLDSKDKIDRAKQYADATTWVNRRDPEYLETLFKYYKSVEDRWRDEYPEYYVDMTDFSKGKQEVLKRISTVMAELTDEVVLDDDRYDEEERRFSSSEVSNHIVDDGSEYLNFYWVAELNKIFKRYNGRGKESKELRGYAVYQYLKRVEMHYGRPELFYKKYKGFDTIIKDIDRHRDKSFHSNRQLVSIYQKLWWLVEQVFGNRMRYERTKK